MSKVLLLTFAYLLTALHNEKGLAALTGKTNHANTNGDAYRLPDTTEPVSYELRITPDIKNNLFSGQVDIVVRAKQYTSEVILNSKDLIVSSVSPFQDLKTNWSTAIKDYVYEQRNERLVVKLEKLILPPRLYKFTVMFSGIVREDFTGFHKYIYDSGNSSRYLYVRFAHKTHTIHIITPRSYDYFRSPTFIVFIFFACAPLSPKSYV